MSKGIVNVRIPEEQHLYLEHLAQILKTTKSDLLREALNTWIQHINRLEQIGIIRLG